MCEMSRSIAFHKIIAKMTNFSNTNKNFKTSIKSVRAIMPALSFLLLILVYAVSAAASALFLSKLIDIAGGVVLAWCISISIQATRAALVFFNQLNPSRPNFSKSGELVAVVMGCISILEILLLTRDANLAAGVGVSLSILMSAGVGIELFLLREIKFATEIELFENKENYYKLRSFYQKRKEFKLFIQNLKHESESERSRDHKMSANGRMGNGKLRESTL